MKRSSAVVLLAFACLFVGHGLSGGRVSASGDEVQKRRLPYVVQRGEHVTLTFAPSSFPSGLSSIECTVADESDMWVRCAPGDASFGANREELWYDLTRVVMVKRVEK